MKIQCDVCLTKEAMVFCTADEAALCESCDKRVHHANKLANKHHRFSLISPNSSHISNHTNNANANSNAPPVCDICQERRAFLFCKEDRAILCRECDTGIHKANEHTQNHNRYLLTGVKLSPSSSPYPTLTNPDPSSSSEYPYSTFDNYNVFTQCSYNDHTRNEEITISDTQPEWSFDDFLDPSSSSDHHHRSI